MNRRPPTEPVGGGDRRFPALGVEKSHRRAGPPRAVRLYLLTDGAALPLPAWRSSPDSAGRMPIVRSGDLPSLLPVQPNGGTSLSEREDGASSDEDCGSCRMRVVARRMCVCMGVRNISG